MSEAAKRLRRAVLELRRTRREGRDKTDAEIRDDEAEYDTAMRAAKQWAIDNPSVTEWGDRGWQEM